MQQMIIFCQAAQPFTEDFFNAGLLLTPVVEPDGPQCVYLDLTGCRVSLSQLQNLVCLTGAGIRAGLASTKLAARLAARAVSLREVQSYGQVHIWPRGTLVEISSEREKQFLHFLPLERFDPLQPPLCKKLRRFGFEKVGDLAALRSYELVRLLGEAGLIIADLVQGIDLSPVLGLYPPSRLLYSLCFTPPAVDLVPVEQAMRQASWLLTAKLQKSDQTCQRVHLEIALDSHPLMAERVLKKGIQERDFLFRTLTGLLAPLVRTAQDFRLDRFTITLDQLAPQSWSQPDLFTHRPVSNQQERACRLDQALTHVEKRFPGFLTRGLTIDRREQILALWDPWRGLS